LGDARVGAVQILARERLEEGRVEERADAAAARVRGEIDGHLDRGDVRGLRAKGAGCGVPQNPL
jgi:hypothetical protein